MNLDFIKILEFVQNYHNPSWIEKEFQQELKKLSVIGHSSFKKNISNKDSDFSKSEKIQLENNFLQTLAIKIRKIHGKKEGKISYLNGNKREKNLF